MKVSVHSRMVRGQVKWEVSRFINGRRRRKYFSDESDAHEHADDLRKQIREVGQVWFEFSARERSDIAGVLHDIREEGLTLRAVWEAYKRGIGGIVKARRTLQQAMDETLAAKTRVNRRQRYVESLRKYLGRFIAGREAMWVDRITPEDIDDWFDGRKEGATTRASNLGRLSAMFDLCYRRDYIPFNPCDKVERQRVSTEMPATLSYQDVTRLLRTCRRTDRQFLPVLVLGLFCGIRPEEAEKLTWKDVDFENSRIRIKAVVSKKLRWRYVPMERRAARWLRWCRRRNENLIPNLKTLRRRRRRLCERTGVRRKKGRRVVWDNPVKWEQDILRKTCASNWMGLYGDAQKVSAWLGNSPKILKAHYVDLVTPEEAARYWGVGARMRREDRARH